MISLWVVLPYRLMHILCEQMSFPNGLNPTLIWWYPLKNALSMGYFVSVAFRPIL